MDPLLQTLYVINYTTRSPQRIKMLPIFKKLGFLYNSYVLGVLTVGYVLGELGHYLIGVTSKQTAIELDYGDHACQQNSTEFDRWQVPQQCSKVGDENS